MSPEERSMIDGLFDRIRGTAAAPRDPEAESHIQGAVSAQPYAPYVMTQTLIVQQHALEAAQARIAELEAQSQSRPAEPAPSFLGGLGKSLFGAGVAQPQPQAQAQARVYRPAAPQPEPYAPPQSGPWGAQAQQPQPGPQPGPWGAAPAGGGFLQQALRTATGVAGGMLAVDALQGLFGGRGGFGQSNAFGGMGGLGGGMGGLGAGLGGQQGGTPNDFSGQNPADAQALKDYDAQQDARQDAQDDQSGQDASQDSGQDSGQDASYDSSGGDSGGLDV